MYPFAYMYRIQDTRHRNHSTKKGFEHAYHSASTPHAIKLQQTAIWLAKPQLDLFKNKLECLAQAEHVNASNYSTYHARILLWKPRFGPPGTDFS